MVKSPPTQETPSLWKCITSSTFILIYLMSFFSLFFVYFMVGSFKNYGELKIKNDDFLSVVGAVSSVCGGLRFIWSAMVDKVHSYKKVFAVLLVIEIILAFTIQLIAPYKWPYLIWVSLAVFCEGGIFALVPTIVSMLFGEQAPKVYGICLTFNGAVALIQAIVVKLYLTKHNYPVFIYT